MKTCPGCGASYTDDLSFCLQDGSMLSASLTGDLTNRPTEVFYPQTDINNAQTIVDTARITPPSPPRQFQMSVADPASRMGCALTIGQVAAALLVVVGLGLVGIFFAIRSVNDVAMMKQAPTISNTAANSTGSSANRPSLPANTSAPPPAYPTPLVGMSNTSGGSPNAKPSTGAPKTVSGGVINGKATSLPKPEYPPAARAVKATGSVSVQVLVDEAGNVMSASAVSGHPLLRAAAEKAAREARFSPTMLAGSPVRVSGIITYNFVP